MYKTWVIFSLSCSFYSNMALRGKLGEHMIQVTSVIRLSHKKPLKGSIEVTGRQSSKAMQKIWKSVPNQPTYTHIHKYTYAHMHTEYKMTKPYSVENNTSHRKSRLQCPVPSVIKPEASACDHSILTLRHQTAPQQYKPIINPRDVPTLKSFPSRPEADQSEATLSHLVRINFCSPVTAGRNRMTQARVLYMSY